MGRRAGSRNLGYFFRSGRGWFTNLDGRMVPLRDADENPLRNKSTPVAELKAAYRRIIAEPVEIVNTATGHTVQDICIAYLNKVSSDGALKTFRDRGDSLFDLCTGFPPRFWDRAKGFSVKPEAKPSDRIHKGYGNLDVAQFLPLYIDQWLAAHKTWKGGRRSRVQAVKRAMNYGVDCGLVPREPGSPLKGYRVAAAIPRVTYLTPEQETAMYGATNSAIAMAIKVCIRTGARPGKEFATLTAQHVKEKDGRMEWVFGAKESKTGKQTRKQRIIRITDPEIIQIVRQQIAKYPQGPIFRNTKGNPQTRKNLELSFRKAKVRLQKQGIELDADACMYSCRHTYAKRTLQGYWTGKQTNIETLARLMGNSPQVCRDHYLQWSDSYEEPLWECA